MSFNPKMKKVMKPAFGKQPDDEKKPAGPMRPGKRMMNWKAKGK